MYKLYLNTAEMKSWLRWLQIAMAGMIYIVANAIDYHFTVYGIMYTNHSEANPIVQGYMDIFGMKQGLLLCKALMVVMINLAVIAADLVCRKRSIKFRPAYILYVGAILTTFAGCLWFLSG